MASSSKPLTAYNLRSQQTTKISDFASALKKALDAVTPTTERYRDVCVLSLHWENDQMGVAKLNSDLLKVFKNDYNFKTMSFQIPVIGSYLALQNKLTKWATDWGKKDLLRILVYSGHAEYSGTAVFKWLIAGRANAQGNLVGPRIDWRRISGILENVDGDLVYMFDCCSAATVAMEDGPETIAATGWEQSGTDNVHFSFTQALIDTLKDLNGVPETVAGIYARLFRNAYQNQVGSCPVHVPKKGSPSITIKRKVGKEVEKLQASKATGSNRVLLSVKTRGEVSESDINSWEKWLTTNIPPGILSVDVKVEAVFRGSGLLLVTIPVQLWTMLPAHGVAYSFVAHVTSSNTLPSMTRNLAIRPPPPSGQENRRPVQPSHNQRKSIG
ncbi:hypothetical protein ABOM_002868 [Aspergillus terreus]|uniref:Uncharacterized protein n=1 Tax=Aspergillus terreus TaxID=33178 RepID=A0A5M3YNZ2_ASPTE|nr:hypothetical protein ATETN484_0002036500 [Aspergillus terreus]GFF15221.1 hypothetical protein ABOM_002868 [Aspergillus terreus]